MDTDAETREGPPPRRLAVMPRRRLSRWVVRLARRSPRLLRALNGVVRRLAGRHRVGAIAVVVDPDGRVLMVRHALRSSTWALPGGWIRAYEDPARAVVREVREELGLGVDPVAAVATESHGGRRRWLGPPSGLTIAFLCRPQRPGAAIRDLSPELLEAAWMASGTAIREATAFEAVAMREALRRQEA